MGTVRRRQAWATAAVLCLCLSLVTPVAGASHAESQPGTVGDPLRTAGWTGQASTGLQTADQDTIGIRQSLALTPERPGNVTTTATYRIPDRVVSLQTKVPENATVVAADGFERVDGRTYAWDEQTDRPTIRYWHDPNRTLERRGPTGVGSGYVFVDAGEWALVERNRLPTKWTYTGDRPTLAVEPAPAGPGAAGNDIVYLGPGRLVERQAHNQTIELFVPDRANMSVGSERVLDSLSDAADAIRIGDRDDRVFVVAAPAGTVDWAVRGLQTGDTDMWVRANETLDEPENVWLHEYVHSRQSFRTTDRTRWLTEATAVYYASLLTLEQDRLGFDRFRDWLARGSQSQYDEVVLADPATWTDDAQYVKGALVAGETDRRIRAATDRERTLQRLLTRLNGRTEPVTQSAFLGAVERAGGSNVSEATAEDTETAAAVEMWNETAHARVFGQLPARVGYALPEPGTGGYSVSGPYRDTVAGQERPIRVVTGETVTADVTVSNAGGTTGTYNATLQRNGTVVATETGRIDPDERLTVPLSATFTSPGQYELGLDGERVTVVVEQPAEPRVTAVEVNHTEVAVGERVRVTATVENDADRPGGTTVVFTRDDQGVAERTIRLPGQTTRKVSERVRLSDPGTVRLSAGGVEPVTVAVTEPTPTPTTPSPTTSTPATTTGSDGTGFTALAALAALVLAALAGQRRR